MQQVHRDQLDFQQNLQQDTTDRPPQFNESYCGYRCGYGCCEPREGEGDGDSDGGGSESSVDSTGITLVDAPAQNPPPTEPPGQRNFVVKGTPHPEGLPILGEIERRRGLVFLTIIDDFVVVTRNPSSNHLPRIQSFESIFNASMIADHSSEYLSSRASNGRRTRGVPSPQSPGLGYPTQFDEEIRLHTLPPAYHFLHPPLRLSPQDELDQGQSPEGASLWQFLDDVERLRGERNFLGL